jgi:hypothetical protein
MTFGAPAASDSRVPGRAAAGLAGVAIAVAVFDAIAGAA